MAEEWAVLGPALFFDLHVLALIVPGACRSVAGSGRYHELRILDAADRTAIFQCIVRKAHHIVRFNPKTEEKSRGI